MKIITKIFAFIKARRLRAIRTRREARIIALKEQRFLEKLWNMGDYEQYTEFQNQRTAGIIKDSYVLKNL